MPSSTGAQWRSCGAAAGSALAHAAVLAWALTVSARVPNEVAAEQPIEIMFEATPTAVPGDAMPAEPAPAPPDVAPLPPPTEPAKPGPVPGPARPAPPEPTPPRPVAPRPAAPRPVAPRATGLRVPNAPPRQAAPGSPAPVPEAAAAPAPPAAAPGVEIGPGWRSSVAGWLQSHKVYPDAARREGVEGRVTVRFTVDRGGRVLSVTVIGSSGAAVLDEAVRQMLEGARLPPFPPEMTQPQASLTVTIRYALER